MDVTLLWEQDPKLRAMDCADRTSVWLLVGGMAVPWPSNWADSNSVEGGLLQNACHLKSG